MLSEERIKQIFFYSDRPRKNALMADEVDIVQFAENLIKAYIPEIAAAEHRRCVNIVRHMNPEVAKALESQRP